jgi:PAS domain S-box-containing protein
MGQSWRLLYDEEEIRRIEAEVFPLLGQHGRWSGTTRGRRKDGASISADICLTIAPTGDLICACRDNSERHRQAEIVRRSQEQLSLVLQATEEGTWDWDITSGTVAYSDQWLGMLGYHAEELPARLETWSERVHPDDWPRVEEEVRAFLQPGGTKLRSEFRLRHRDGSWRWISDRGKVVTRDANGRALRAVGAHTDITSRRTVELALEQRTRELIEANAGLARAAQVRDEFLARISHELRTPLTTILALVEMLLGSRGDALSERQRNRILSVQESGRHLVDLIDEVLDLAKLEAGTMKVALETVPVLGIAERAVRLIAPHAQRKELRLSFEPGPQGLAVIADPLRLKQILVNLLNNAVKFTSPGGEVNLTVTPLRRTADAAWVELRVKDTGIGIAPEKLGQIFQPFVQLESGLNRSFGGSGLGLAIVKHFTEMQGGEIIVASQPGQGSEFCVRLPAGACPSEIAPAPATATATATAGPDPGWEILLVDDNRINRTLVAEFLEEEGFKIHTAASGPAALTCLETNRIALALVDVQMPGMDGLELTRRVRTHTHPRIAGTRIVGVTALAMSGDRERCLAAGMDSYLAKPFALSALSALIRQLQEEDRLGGH